MTAYVLDSVGTNSVNIGGGNMTPAMPAGAAAGKLLIIQASVNSISIGAPVISGWQLLATFTTVIGEALYGRVFQPGDVSPTFQWDASHQSLSRIACFSGDVYTDLTTILLGTPMERATNTKGSVPVSSFGPPAIANALILRGGHCSKTAVNNAASFGEWDTNPGILTKIGTDAVMNGTAIASTWWYWQQAAATGISADTSDLPTTEATANNAQGWTIALKTASVPLPVGDTSYPDYVPRRSAHAAVQQFWSVPDTITSLPPAVPPPPNIDFTMPRKRQMPLAALEQLTNTLPLGTDRVLQPTSWDYEWDKPSLPNALRAESQGLTALEMFATQNLPPYQEFNWPVPSVPKQFNRGFESGYNLNLLGQDAMPPGGPQKNMWDPPRGPRRPVANLSELSSGLSLFFFVPPKPVGGQSLDLPPQPAKRLRQDTIQGLNAQLLTFLSTLPPFPPCTDLPPPRKRRLMSLSYEYNGSLLYLVVNTPPPGRSTQEMPSFRRRQRSPALYEVTQFAQLNPPLPPPGPPASSGQVAGPGGRIIFMPKKVGETVIRPFDFISRLGASEKILTAVTTASVYSGTDGNPAAIINGSAAIAGTIVNQSLTGGVLGVIYELLCTVVTSLGQRLEMSAFWVVEPDLP